MVSYLPSLAKLVASTTPSYNSGYVVVITTAQIHSTKPELRFCRDSNLACAVSEIRDGEDL